MSYNFDCLVCRDVGKDTGCPRCGKKLAKVKHKGESTEVELSLEQLSNLKVPLHYLNNKWDKSILVGDYNSYDEDISFIRYVKELTDGYNLVCSGGNFKKSLLITSPIAHGKTTWVYNCQIQLARHGYSTVPLIDTSQLRRMLTINSERPTWSNKIYEYSFKEYMNADILFVTITKGPEYIYAFETIIEVLDVRARQSKPTVIISDRSIGDLMGQDVKERMLRIINGGTSVDPMKYCIPIEFYM